MLAVEVLKRPEALADRPIYALSGDDAFLHREVECEIARRVLGEEPADFGVREFAGEEASLADVLDELHTLPFFGSRRLAVVSAADSFVSRHRKELESYAESPSKSGVLILHVKSWPSNTRLAKIVDTQGMAIDCKGAEAKSLASWLVSTATRKHGVTIDDETARLLLDLVGDEPGILAAELGKLASSSGESNRISRDLVGQLVGGGRVEEVWSAIESAATGNTSEALLRLDRLLAAGEPPVKLLAAITFSLLRVHHAGQLRRAGVEARDACRRAGVFAGSVERVLKQHTHLGPSRVSGLPARLLKADLDLKGNSALPPRAILESLFTELAQPRRD
jgi:DNA polymerase-3 subunit delta